MGKAANGIAMDSQGKVTITGSIDGVATFGSLSVTSQGGPDAFVAKLNGTTGVFTAAVGLGGSGVDFGSALAVDAHGNVYVTGGFSQTATFGSFTLTTRGDEDAFVVELDGNLNVLAATQMGGNGRDQGLGIVVDALGYVDTTGSFGETGQFPLSPLSLTSSGITNIFVTRQKKI